MNFKGKYSYVIMKDEFRFPSTLGCESVIVSNS